MSRLRSYAWINKRSEKSHETAHEQAEAYALVDARSDGRCEIVLEDVRCSRRASDHHHLTKRRASHNTPDEIIHVCRSHHDRTEWPFHRGRLLIDILGQGTFVCTIRYAKDKFSARLM